VLSEDALQQLRCWLARPTLRTSQLGFGRDEPAFHGRLKNGRAVPLQIALDAFKSHLGLLETGRVRIDGFDDAALFGKGWQKCFDCIVFIATQAWNGGGPVQPPEIQVLE